MEKEWVFDKDFLRKKVEEGEYLLTKKNLDDELAANIESMLNNFYDYLMINNEFNGDRKSNICLEDVFKKLTFKFNKDLFRLDLENWENMRNICWSCEKPSFPTSNTHKLNLGSNKIINSGLKFYKGLDLEFYRIASEIINNPVSLINFSKNKNLYDHCFACDYLKLPFINVYNENDMSVIWFVHELQHGIDYMLFGDVPYIFSELSPIFAETIYIDKLSQSKSEKLNYNRFYSYRIHTNNEEMDIMFHYIETLYRFIENGCEINKDNVSNILCQNNEKGILNEYSKLSRNNYLEIYKYILSFMQSTQIREYYYQNKKEALSLLKHIMLGANYDTNFDDISNSYRRYVYELKKKTNR